MDDQKIETTTLQSYVKFLNYAQIFCENYVM